MPEPTDPAKVTVDAGGRRLVVSNLDKVIYPATETTKGEVLHYYARIAPVLLPHLAGRPVTRVRFPEGVEGLNFFEKNLPSGAPAWLPRVTLTHTSEPITYPMVTGLDALTYLANLASLEFHVPQWQIGADGLPAFPDRLVVDLDPGPGAGLQECSIVALLARERLRALGLDPIPVTSGSKGMQLYAALPGSHASADIALVARTLAQELTAAHPDLVVWKMTTSLRPGKVFFDHHQPEHPDFDVNRDAQPYHHGAGCGAAEYHLSLQRSRYRSGRSMFKAGHLSFPYHNRQLLRARCDADCRTSFRKQLSWRNYHQYIFGYRKQRAD